MDIAVVGSIALDNLKTPFGERKNIVGGSSVYFSIASSILASVGIIGVVGNDFPKSVITKLNKRKIDTSGIEIVDKGKTFHWEGEYKEDFNTAITHKTDLNVFQTFNPKVPDGYKKTKYLFLANIDPEIQKKVLDSFDNLKLSVIDTMNFWIENKKSQLTSVLKNVDIALFNDNEVKMFTGKSSLIAAGKSILKLGLKYVIIKRGDAGFLLLSEKKAALCSAYPFSNVKDPTGAGDSFAGAFLSYIAYHKKHNFDTVKKAALYANILASFTVESFGTDRLEKLKKSDIKMRDREFRKLVSYD